MAAQTTPRAPRTNRPMPELHPRPLLAAALAVLLGLPAAAALAQQGAPPAAQAPAARRAPAVGPYDVVKVVDGDTLHVERDGALEKLRLSCVDTEEKLTGRAFDADKPETVFGEECAQWAQEFFAALAPDGGRPQVRLVFPGGREERDVYGRLLCYVELADGRNFNVLLVEQGKSPYFNKYGDSLLFDRELRAAQERARAERIGIWAPETNRPATPDAPAARRDYERLLPWWEARAKAVEGFRARRGEDPGRYVAADEPEALAAAARRGEPVHVFATIDRLFDEKDGTLTVLLRTGHRERAVRVRVPAEKRDAFAGLDLERSSDAYRQNYLWITGRLRDTGRGFELDALDPAAWKLAGPEPAFAKPAGTAR